jgi:uncharacterized iron-regulated membrane protein
VGRRSQGDVLSKAGKEKSVTLQETNHRLLSARAIRAWYVVHKWTSLVCTVVLLLLCVTGLPLIFHHEIEELTGDAVEAPEMPPGTPNASVDRVVAAALANRAGHMVRFVSWDKDHPGVVFVGDVPSLDAPPEDTRWQSMDARTAAVLKAPEEPGGFLYTMLKLHTDLFAGLPGSLFLGFMGLLFLTATVSGVVLYAPFMRRLPFGTVRRERTARTKWLDLHNLLGIVTLVWVFVVGATGVINTWADIVLDVWRNDQLAEMTRPYAGKPPARTLGSLDRALAVAGEAAPGMTPGFVAYPGSPFSSPQHYAVFMRGGTPLTARLLKPVLIDAERLTLTAAADMPWYVTTLLVSQPLHFGDYGGMPMKIIWAALDILTIVVLGSGLYLWVVRRKGAADRAILEPAE